RHTRSKRDWSSDVCSSDLNSVCAMAVGTMPQAGLVAQVPFVDLAREHDPLIGELQAAFNRVLEANAYILGEEVAAFEAQFAAYRSEERRVGKECRGRWAAA